MNLITAMLTRDWFYKLAFYDCKIVKSMLTLYKFHR